MNRLQEKYQNEIRKTLQEEFGFKNMMEVPAVEKVVINIGIGEAKDNKEIVEKVSTHLKSLSGQQPIVRLARKSIANFKLSKGQPVGLMVTLRGTNMYAFLDKLFSIVLPKVRDFRGVSDQALDDRGNFTLGLKEQLVFPEVDYKTVDKSRGLAVTIVTTSKLKNISKRLLELLGMPFKEKTHG